MGGETIMAVPVEAPGLQAKVLAPKAVSVAV